MRFKKTPEETYTFITELIDETQLEYRQDLPKQDVLSLYKRVEALREVRDCILDLEIQKPSDKISVEQCIADITEGGF